jgi:hypothetical protein
MHPKAGSLKKAWFEGPSSAKGLAGGNHGKSELLWFLLEIPVPRLITSASRLRNALAIWRQSNASTSAIECLLANSFSLPSWSQAQAANIP